VALHARLAATCQREPQVRLHHYTNAHATHYATQHAKLMLLCRCGGAGVWCSTLTGSVAMASGSGSSLSSCPHKDSPTLCSITKVPLGPLAWALNLLDASHALAATVHRLWAKRGGSWTC
jgi:hypothetical protein